MFKIKKGLTIIDLYFLRKELSILIGSKLNQVYQTDTMLEFNLFKRGGFNYTLIISLPSWIYISNKKHEHKQNPPSFSTFLRKKINGSFIKSIDIVNSERIFRFDFVKDNDLYSLFVELIPPGNIILCNSNRKILLPLKMKKWSNRVIRKDETYTPLLRDYNLFNLNETEFCKLIQSGKKIIKSLAVDLGFGGDYSNELLLRAKVDGNLINLSYDQKKKIYFVFKQLLNENINATVYFNDNNVFSVTPFNFFIYNSYQSKSFKSFSDAIEFYIDHINPYFSKAHLKQMEKIKKIKSIINVQTETITNLEQQISDLSRIPDLIYSHYNEIQELIMKIKQMIDRKEYNKINDLKEDYPFFKSFDPKERKIIISF